MTTEDVARIPKKGDILKGQAGDRFVCETCRRALVLYDLEHEYYRARVDAVFGSFSEDELYCSSAKRERWLACGHKKCEWYGRRVEVPGYEISDAYTPALVRYALMSDVYCRTPRIPRDRGDGGHYG